MPFKMLLIKKNYKRDKNGCVSYEKGRIKKSCFIFVTDVWACGSVTAYS